MLYSTLVVWLEIFLFSPQKIAIEEFHETIFKYFLAFLEEKTHFFYMSFDVKDPVYEVSSVLGAITNSYNGGQE